MNTIKKYMKNFLKISLVLTLFITTSCQDKLNDNFYDPEKMTKPTFDMLFSGVLQTPDLFRQDYGSNYHLIRFSGRVLGLGYFPDQSRNKFAPDGYKHWTDWSGSTLRNNLWNFVYVNANKNVPVMNLMINNLPEAERKDYEVYTMCVNVLKAYMFQRLTDAYDDVPYSEAGGAFQEVFLAKYDTQKDIYYSILDELKTLSNDLSSYQITNPAIVEKFKVSDYVNGGDLKKWAMFANSIRLRMAIRISVVDPAKSKTIIEEIQASPAGLIEENSQEVGMVEKNLAQIWESYYPRSMYELYYQGCTKFFLNTLLGYSDTAPTNQIDPRTYVIFQKNNDGRYLGCAPWGQDQEDFIDADFPSPTFDDAYRDGVKKMEFDYNREPPYSCYNKMTYYNFNMKLPTVSPSEVHLLKAEAGVRFGLGINVSDEYKKALTTSIDWYYETNNKNPYNETSSPANIKPLIMPDSQYPKNQANIDDFVAYKVGLFNAMSNKDKVKEIFYQKYIHMNYLNAMEIWSEARRLIKEQGNLIPRSPISAWMERFYYPDSEPLTNPDNYAKVAGKDGVDTPVWWSGREKK